MKIKLVIHIGAGKTGSSAIQESLAQNKEQLLNSGVLVPGYKLDLESECKGEQIWFFQNGINDVEFNDAVRRRLGRLHKHMREENLHTLILSAENLINPENFQRLFIGIESDFDISIICYIRRQDDYMISAWQQWYLKAYDSFDDYVNEMAHRVDWHSSLKPWKDAFGANSIKVRLYEKTRLINGNVVDDFLTTCDLNIDNWKPIEKRVNQSIDEKFNAISNKYRAELFSNMHDNLFYQFLFDSFGEKAFKSYKGSSELTLSQRKNLLVRFKESDDAMIRDYFPDRSGQSLFVAPDASDVYERNNDTFCGELDYMLVGMFGLYKRFMVKAG